MKKLARRLRSERGELLLDSMIGIVIIAVVMTASVGVLMLAATSSTGAAHNSARTALVHNMVSDEKPRIGSYTSAPTALTALDGNEGVPVTLWREEKTSTLAVLHAATARHGVQASACSDPADLMPGKCIQASVAVPQSRSGVAVTAVPTVPGAPGALFAFTVPAGATELRFVLKADTVPDASTVVFTNTAQVDITHTVAVPAGQTGYYYGRILVDAGATISVSSPGTLTLDPSATMIYEAP